MFVRMTGHRDGNADECDPRLVDDSGKKPPLRTEGVPHECARGCVTVPLGRRVVALGDPRVAGSLSATTLVLFRRPGRKNDDSGVVQSRRVISRGHLDSPWGLLLLPVDISVAGREKDKNGWSAKCQKERLFSGQVEPGTEIEDPTEKNQRPPIPTPLLLGG